MTREEFLNNLATNPDKGFKKIQLKDMVEFLKAYGTREEKDEFQKACMTSVKDKDGNITAKYNHLGAVRWFCSKYIPDIVPQRKKPKASDLLKELD